METTTFKGAEMDVIRISGDGDCAVRSLNAGMTESDSASYFTVKSRISDERNIQMFAQAQETMPFLGHFAQNCVRGCPDRKSTEALHSMTFIERSGSGNARAITVEDYMAQMRVPETWLSQTDVILSAKILQLNFIIIRGQHVEILKIGGRG